MKHLDTIIQYLKHLDPEFYGHVVIKIRSGKAVLITEERTIKIHEDQHPKPPKATGIT